MKTEYVKYLVDQLIPGQSATVYPVIHGCNVSSVYQKQVQCELAEQPNNQFTVVRGNGDLNVRLNKEVKNVCHECGSPEFKTSVIEEYSSYIDPCHNKAKLTRMLTRMTHTYCRFCNTTIDVKVHRYPEVH